MKITQQILVSGQVQGVSFRYFTKSNAEAIGVSGWVRNLSDGRVEALVQGRPEQLESLRMKLTEGPVRANVRQLEVREVQFYKEYNVFEIVDDGDSPCSIKK